jgi:hypothetical protein
MASIAAQLCKDFLCFIRTNEIVSQDPLDGLNTLVDDFVIVGAAILTQKKFQNIDGYICTLLDLFGQILTDDFSIKVLSQLGLNHLTGALICHK